MHGKLKHFKIVSAFFPMHRRQSKLMPVFLSLQELELLAHNFFVKTTLDTKHWLPVEKPSVNSLTLSVIVS